MGTKKSILVVIDKKEYLLSGFEGEEYLQSVASYINQKIAEMNRQESYRGIPQDMKNLMLNLNLADDYFKAKERADSAEQKFTGLEKEIYELKHQLIDTQMQLDDANAKIAEASEKLETTKNQNIQIQQKMNLIEAEKGQLQEKVERLNADLEEILLK